MRLLPAAAADAGNEVVPALAEKYRYLRQLVPMVPAWSDKWTEGTTVVVAAGQAQRSTGRSFPHRRLIFRSHISSIAPI